MNRERYALHMQVPLEYISMESSQRGKLNLCFCRKASFLTKRNPNMHSCENRKKVDEKSKVGEKSSKVGTHRNADCLLKSTPTKHKKYGVN